MARDRWIPGVTIKAGTSWGMTKNATFGIYTARTRRTWVATFVVDACATLRAVTIYDAFWSTLFVRIAEEFWHTSA